jgi:hypothetical protein
MVLTDVQKTGLEAAILAYLVAEGGRFTRTVAAFKEEAQNGGGGGGGEEDVMVVSGLVMEKAWAFVRENQAQNQAFFLSIKSGDLSAVQLHVCVGVDIKALRAQQSQWDQSPFQWVGSPCSALFYAAGFNRMEIVQFFVRTGHDKEAGADNGASPHQLTKQLIESL